MSDSLVFLRNRADEFCIFEPADIPHTDDLSPILLLAAVVISAGYAGVAVDELKLSDGRFVQSVDVNLATPEGKIFQKLTSALESGRTLPDANAMLEAIRQVYESLGRLQKLPRPSAKENK